MRHVICIVVMFAVALAPAIADPPAHAEWELTFADEFDGDAVDWDVWASASRARGPDKPEGRWPENNVVRDGILYQTTRREDPPRGGKSWSTAHIWTREFTQQYGYFECRMRYGRYLNNAFWLVRPRGKFDRPHFEIDINEGHTPRDVAMTCHYYKYFPGEDEPEHYPSGKVWRAPVDLDRDFHVYGCEWDAERIIWYFDGRPVRALINPGADAPADMRLSTVIMTSQLERDGVDIATMDGVAMAVDWVRVYRKVRDLREPTGLPEAESMNLPTIVEADPQVTLDGERAIILDEDFAAVEIGALPEGWQVGEGHPSVAEDVQERGKPVLAGGGRLLRLEAGDYAFVMFNEPVSGRLEIEMDVCQPGGQPGLLLVTLGDFDASDPEGRAASYYTGDIGPYIHWSGNYLRWYTEAAKWHPFARLPAGKWYHLRYLLDVAAGVFDCYEGDRFIGGGPFRHAQRAAHGIGIKNRGGPRPVYVDNIVVRTVK
ncbi:MAG: glycoside hydrolase family 16 protein [Armatimonadetes bacterium]|nr:glycoside hydrolase family 16 protein [Armatimonadota bacterium]